MSTLKQKIVGRVTFKNLSPLAVGSGRGDFSDKDIALDFNGKPYIPASAIAGVIESFIKQNFDLNAGDKLTWQQFWGTSEDSNPPFQSHLRLGNAISLKDDFVISILDGIKINPATQNVEQGAKYDYQVLEPGATFSIDLELTLRDGFKIEKHHHLLSLFLAALRHPDLRFGAFTTSDMGAIEGVCFENFYYLNNSEDFINWLDNVTSKLEVFKPDSIKARDKEYIDIVFNFNQKNQLLTAVKQFDKNEPDKVQLSRKSSTEYYLSSKAIRGVIGHRFRKIGHTLEIQDTENIYHDLFGQVGKENKKAKLRVVECILKEAKTQPQTRIKIDRFTGATIDNALFKQEPITGGSGEILFRLNDPTDTQLYLILQCFKDLFDSYLAIGSNKNIGYGRLKGNSLIVKKGENTILQFGTDENIIDESILNLKLPENVAA